MTNEEQMKLNDLENNGAQKGFSEQKSNTIYAQYLRYRISLEDKKSALKFSEFCNFMYSQQSINNSSVEEVKGRRM